jgi:hypothetical protein
LTELSITALFFLLVFRTFLLFGRSPFHSKTTKEKKNI